MLLNGGTLANPSFVSDKPGTVRGRRLRPRISLDLSGGEDGKNLRSCGTYSWSSNASTTSTCGWTAEAMMTASARVLLSRTEVRSRLGLASRES